MHYAAKFICRKKTTAKLHENFDISKRVIMKKVFLQRKDTVFCKISGLLYFFIEKLTYCIYFFFTFAINILKRYIAEYQFIIKYL
jgi:hypothetical protein